MTSERIDINTTTVTELSTEKATFAAGCFWGVEKVFRRNFGSKPGFDARVGYIGGKSENPSYREVCSGTTNHAEAVQITFNPENISYETLVEFFYKIHDPTTQNRQGNDTGTQYRSAIFYHSPEQKGIAERVTNFVQEKSNNEKELYQNREITTEISEAGTFYNAEDYHQDYLVSFY
ncbi:5_t:CDS:2 [Ambispora leptoticha]|uniref:peptide-methionine (S)-S-oxide reductase n=1 Tax=Ambispora leptoticha TaxID=144679 RepID=A0A9N9FPJ8_9GLOM|nr:5_t:CDS:2 [Ambispora leptoticha]